MNIKEMDKQKVNKTIVVYAGRYQPFHKGHYASYKKLTDKFGVDNVYIGSSNDTSSPKSPFSFSEKKKIATKMFGIPSSKFVMIKNPYQPVEILNKYDGDTTQYVAAVGEKDATRLKGKYFKPYKGKPEAGYNEHGYVYAVPSEPNPISGTDVRNGMGSADEEAAKEFFTKKAYNKFNPEIFKLIRSKLLKETVIYDPIANIVNNIVFEEIFNDFVSDYVNEEEKESNPIYDKEIEYTAKNGNQKKIKVRDALRLPKKHPAHVQAKKLTAQQPAPPAADKDTEKPDKGAGSSAKPSGQSQPTAGAAPTEKPAQSLSGAELKTKAEVPSAEREKMEKAEKIKRELDTVKNELSDEEKSEVDTLNNPASKERASVLDAIKRGASKIGHGIKHVIQHKKEMVTGSIDAVKSLASTGKIGSVKDKNGKSRHWSEFANKDSKGKPEYEVVETDVLNSHGHSTGKKKKEKVPKLKEGATDEEKELFEKSYKEGKRQKHALKGLAFEAAVIVGSIAVTGAFMGGFAAAKSGAGVSGIAKGAVSKAAYKLTGGHLGEYIVKDVIKHSAFEALGARTAQASAGGIG